MSPWRPDFVETKCGEEEPAGVETGDTLISTTKDFNSSSSFRCLRRCCRLEANHFVPLVNVSMPCAQPTVKRLQTGPLFGGYMPIEVDEQDVHNGCRGRIA